MVVCSSLLAVTFLSGGKKIAPKSPTFHACKPLANIQGRHMKIQLLPILIVSLALFGCYEVKEKSWTKNCLTRELDFECYTFLDSILNRISSIEKAETIKTVERVFFNNDSSLIDSLEIYKKPNGQLFAIKKHRGILNPFQRQFFKIDETHFVVIFPKIDGPKHIDSAKTNMNIILFRDSSIILFRNIGNRLVDSNYKDFEKYEDYYWTEIKKTFANSKHKI